MDYNGPLTVGPNKGATEMEACHPEGSLLRLKRRSRDAGHTIAGKAKGYVTRS